MIKNYILALSLFLPFNLYAETFIPDSVQIFFGDLTELECCSLLQENERAPFTGFILTPYQLVLLKDTIDSWEQEMNTQIQLADNLCNQKINLCIDEKNIIIDDLKDSFSFYQENNDLLLKQNKSLQEDLLYYKYSLFIALPLAIISTWYIFK